MSHRFFQQLMYPMARNVLKERREKREENGATKQDTGAPPVGQTTIQRPVVKKRAIVEALKPQTTTKAEQLRREYNRAWIVSGTSCSQANLLMLS